MRLEAIRSVYFVGAGGIGMSALIRYFLSKGKTVAGYDRTSSELTERLIRSNKENIDNLITNHQLYAKERGNLRKNK